jgi:hypothetical protein
MLTRLLKTPKEKGIKYHIRIKFRHEKFQVLTAASMKMIAFWDITPGSLVASSP